MRELTSPKWRKKTPPTEMMPGTMIMMVLLVRLGESSLAMSSRGMNWFTRSGRPSNRHLVPYNSMFKFSSNGHKGREPELLACP